MSLDRRFYIGSSGAAAVLGLGDHTARLLYWKEKGPNGVQKEPSGIHIQRGNYTEPLLMSYVRRHLDPSVADYRHYHEHDDDTKQARAKHEAAAKFACDVTSGVDAFVERKVRDGQQIFLLDRSTLASNGEPYIGGHPDDLGDETVWEYKAPAMRNLDRIKREGLPATWFYQVQHMMMLTGKPKGAVAIWDYDEWCPYVFRFEADPDLHAIMREEYAIFWESVLAGVPPEPRTPRMAEHWAVCTETDLTEMIAAYREATDAYYAADRKRADLKGKIITFAQGRETIITPTHLCKVKFITTKKSSYYKLTVTENDTPLSDDDGD